MIDGKPMPAFGDGDTSLRAIGGQAGVRTLVAAFYDRMEQWPQAARILKMHGDLALAREKLEVFLVGWLGGPKRYAERWGQIRIPVAHAHLKIDEADAELWLRCMDHAIDQAEVSAEFRAYFKAQIRVPAGRVVQASQATRAARQQR